MEKDLISVVIPTYNREEKIARAIDSVLAQTYDNIEVIIVDDGSTDHTRAVIEAYEDSRIHFYENERNMGPAEARNRGVSYASGNYIAFQDSDDEWLPDKLRRQKNLMDEKGVDLVFCAFESWKGGELTGIVRMKDGEATNPDQFYPLFLVKARMGAPTILVKKEAFENIGGFEGSLTSQEDYEFSIRFASEYRIAYISDALVRAYSSHDSVNVRWQENLRSHIKIMEEFFTDLRGMQLDLKKYYYFYEFANSVNCLSFFISEYGKMCDRLALDALDPCRTINEAAKYQPDIANKYIENTRRIQIINQFTEIAGIVEQLSVEDIQQVLNNMVQVEKQIYLSDEVCADIMELCQCSSVEDLRMKMSVILNQVIKDNEISRCKTCRNLVTIGRNHTCPLCGMTMKRLSESEGEQQDENSSAVTSYT